MKETPKKPGAHEEMLELQRLRQEGLLNAPVKGARGIGGWHGLAAKLCSKWGGRDHPLDWVDGRPPRKLL